MSFHIHFVNEGIDKLFHGCSRASYDISKYNPSASNLKQSLLKTCCYYATPHKPFEVDT